MIEVVICGAVAYENIGHRKWPIRCQEEDEQEYYQAFIDGMWTNIRVLGFMDYDPLWKGSKYDYE